MNILIIASVWPEPTSSAAGRRMMDLLTLFIRQGWTLTYACTATESPYRHPIESLGIKIATVVINDSSFDSFIHELSPDLVLYDRLMLEEQFSWRVEKQCPQAMTMLETSDLHCLRYARQDALKKGRPFSADDLNSEMAYREIASIQRSDLTLVISSYEMELLTRVFKVNSSLIYHFPFIVEPNCLEENKQNWPTYEAREGFMCIGNFKHAPNWDSVQYLKQEIWPKIRQRLPQANLYVYGAYPPPKALQLNKPAEGFYIKGRAENAQEVMRSARVCLAPLRFGAGLKGKLLEAMECGTPSVTTTIGAEAMHGELPWNGAISDEPDAIAEAAVALYENKARWQDEQQKGLDIIKHCFNAEDFEQALINKILSLQADLTAHRRQNFQGAMLRHHLLRSSKYMSLWIEEKNKGSE